MAVRVGIFGASGYAGAELAQLIVRHPALELVVVTSETSAGESLASLFPQAPALRLVASADVDPATIDFAFLCLPHGVSAPVAAALAGAGVRLVDLSADLRLADLATYARIYGKAHAAPELLPAPYGLPELWRPDLSATLAVANPGCYATATLLALAPLVPHLQPGRPVVVNAVSGASGAGRAPQTRLLFCEVAENVVPYRLGRTHHHVAEIEQQLEESGWPSGGLIFNPHVVPAVRGLLATATLEVDDVEAAHRALAERYGGEPLVEVLAEGEVATFAHVVRSPRAVLGFTRVGPHTVVVTSAIDNLLKGAASQAVQNANRMLGFPETAGLLGGGR
jgi:N-acetyl-gamma-glutamyl-phosphate reductase